jgi:single-strand DNA-binding protein
MNLVAVVGNLASDPMVYGADEKTVINFTVFDNQVAKDSDSLDYRCVMFGKRAQSVSVYLKKGTLVSLKGTEKWNKYTDKEGTERKNRVIEIEGIQVLSNTRQTVVDASKAGETHTYQEEQRGQETEILF